MRIYIVIAAFLLLGLAAGCAKPWSNPDAGNKQQARVRFDRDSVNCQASVGEEYPLDKRRQNEAYDMCMEKKGWKRERQGDGYQFNFRK